MNCPKCGKTNGEQDKFCFYCGANLSDSFNQTGVEVNPVSPVAEQMYAPAAPRMSKVFFLTSIGLGLGLFSVALTVALIMILINAGISVFLSLSSYSLSSYSFSTLSTPIITLTAAGLLLLLFAVVVLMVFIYRMWASIQDGYARMTPGQAVGFLFIPLFNLYWIFQVFSGFAQDFNRLLYRRGHNTTPLPEGLFVAYPILIICSMIPFIGQLASIAAFVLLLLIVAKICDGVNALGAVSYGTAEYGWEDTYVNTNEKLLGTDRSSIVTKWKQARPILKGIAGTYAGNTIELEGLLNIGRDPGMAQLVYPHSKTEISRKHCSLYYDAETRKFVLEDYSSNGTYLSNFKAMVPGRSYYLSPGEQFYLADTREVFEVELL